MPSFTKLIRRGLSSSSSSNTATATAAAAAAAAAAVATAGGSAGLLSNKNNERKKSKKNSNKNAVVVGQSLVSETASTELKFEDYYKLSKKLSKGSFGVVYVTQHKVNGQEFAVKVIDRHKLSEKELIGVRREVQILKDCRDVVNIVQLVDYFANPDTFYVVQVYARGGDVFERLANRTSYTENDARNLAKHLLQAMQVLHSRKLAHRDLKPENLLLRDLLDDTMILVADFGFASYVPPEGLRTRCGTPAFVAPEVLVTNCRYDERVDMWSVGCLLYMLIGGYPPFQDKSHRGLFRKVRHADYVFHDTYWKHVSVAAKSLIASLLIVDPQYRCAAQNALNSDWLTLDESLLKAHDLTASLGEIKKFHARRSLKGAIHAVRSTVRMKFKSANDVVECSESDSFDKEGTNANLNEDDNDSTMNSREDCYVRDPIVKETSDSILATTVRPTPDFHDAYELGDLIHKGQSSKVYECTSRGTGQVYACKIVTRKQKSRKSVSGKTMAETVLYEVALLDSLKHDNIMSIHDMFEDDQHFFLVMDRMRGGDVFDRVMKEKRYPEPEARKLAQAILSAVAYFHGQGIAHRDLKPQNLLLKTRENSWDIKVSDFGFACRVKSAQSLTTRCGTPTYVAPEILKNVPYDQSADLWSVGVILYVLLCGYPPFVNENQSELFRRIRSGEWRFRSQEWDSVSDGAKHLIRRLLVVNPVQRLTAKEALGCDWLKNDRHSTFSKLERKEAPASLTQVMKGTDPTNRTLPSRKENEEQDIKKRPQPLPSRTFEC